jgi:hypothetical protein
MKNDFKAYLNEQKLDNKYSSTINPPKLDERILSLGSEKRINGYAVNLDFTNEAVINRMADLSDAKVNPDDTAEKAKEEKDKFTTSFKQSIYQIIKSLTENAKKVTLHGLARLKGWDFKGNLALAGIETVDDHTLSYIFFPGPKDDPERHAKRFIDLVGQDRNTAFLKGDLKLVDREFSPDGMDKESIFFDPEHNESKIIEDRFTTTVFSLTYKKVKAKLDDAKTSYERGNLISVYTTPYKIDEDIIVNIAKQAAREDKGLEEFYTALVTKIAEDLNDFLTQKLEKEQLEDYLGFVPTKTYGFNLYFKDKDVAIDAANILNEGDDGESKVKEMKRYEKKIAKYRQSIDPSRDVNWFRGLQFSVKTVANLVKAILPNIEDQVTVYQYSVEYTKEYLQKVIKDNAGSNEVNYKTGEGQIESFVESYIKDLIKRLKEKYEKQLIGITSEGKKLKFIFTSNTTELGIKSTLAALIRCEEKNIIPLKTALTKTEIGEFHKNLESMSNFKSITDAANIDIQDTKKKFVGAYSIVVSKDHLGEFTPNTILGSNKTGSAWILKLAESVTSFKQNLCNKLMETINLVNEAEAGDKELSTAALVGLLKNFADPDKKLNETREGQAWVNKYTAAIINYVNAAIKSSASNANDYIEIVENSAKDGRFVFKYAEPIEESVKKAVSQFASKTTNIGKIVDIQHKNLKEA